MAEEPEPKKKVPDVVWRWRKTLANCLGGLKPPYGEQDWDELPRTTRPTSSWPLPDYKSAQECDKFVTQELLYLSPDLAWVMLQLQIDMPAWAVPWLQELKKLYCNSSENAFAKELTHKLLRDLA
ncbi:unnamed protein product [Symbiodinium sp. CCMP2592]|nr:unnamed protein product [Symbiodinium sp. CCMP2592]